MAASLERLLAAIADQYDKLPDGSALIDKLSRRFRAVFDQPPTGALADALHSEIDEDQARILLFQPSVSQAESYIAMLLSKSQLENGSSLRALALSLLFLHHKSSWAFMADFVLHSGLNALVEVVEDANLYERSQAIDVLMSIVNCADFDWFKAPQCERERALHSELLRAGLKTRLLSSLLVNRTGSYPGGSLCCLQIMAFWMSWARSMGVSSESFLTSDIRGGLLLWVAKDADECDGPDELVLARTMLDDFFSTVTDASPPAEEAAAALPQELKQRGNEHYKCGRYEKAVECYTSALARSDATSDPTRLELVVSLRVNIANAQWKIFRRSRNLAALQAAEDQCLSVLQVDPSASKAIYRLSCCHLASGRVDAASALLAPMGLTHLSLPGGGTGTALDDKERAIFRRLGYHVLALEMLRAGAQSGPALSPLVFQTYKELLTRYGASFEVTAEMQQQRIPPAQTSRWAGAAVAPEPPAEASFFRGDANSKVEAMYRKSVKALVAAARQFGAAVAKLPPAGDGTSAAAWLPEREKQLLDKVHDVVEKLQRLGLLDRAFEAPPSEALVVSALFILASCEASTELTVGLAKSLLGGPHAKSALFRAGMEFGSCAPQLTRTAQQWPDDGLGKKRQLLDMLHLMK